MAGRWSIGPKRSDGSGGADARFLPDGNRIMAFYNADRTAWLLDVGRRAGIQLDDEIVTPGTWTLTVIPGPHGPIDDPAVDAGAPAVAHCPGLESWSRSATPARHTRRAWSCEPRHRLRAVMGEILWQPARKGDHDALAQLAGAPISRLHATAWLMIRDADRPTDAVQNALVRAAPYADAARPGPIRRLDAPVAGERLHRRIRRVRKHRLDVDITDLSDPPFVAAAVSRSPIGTNWNAGSSVSVRTNGRSSSCITTSICLCQKWRRRWASRWAPPSHACIADSARCERRSTPTRSRSAGRGSGLHHYNRAMAHTVTLIPGDGIGPELAEATRRVLERPAWFEWERRRRRGRHRRVRHAAAGAGARLDPRNKVALKGPITTPVGEGFRSVNVTLRQALDLYANLRPARSIKGVETRYEDVDLVIVRENTEDLYAGIEHMVGRDAAESIKIITRDASERIARFAFDYAVANGRRKVTAVHKANIMKLSDGLFLESCRTVAAEYEGRIEFEDRIVDNMCMQLVQKPDLYDVLVLPNLYGDIVSDLGAGLVGGLGVAPGANIGIEAAVFEPVHGSAPKYAGQDMANPTALILSGALMLRHLGEPDAAERVEAAVRDVIAEGTCRDPTSAARPARARSPTPSRSPERAASSRRRPLTAAGRPASRLPMLLRYRGSEGMLAWAFHRISGIGIFAFVVLHVGRHLPRRRQNPKLYDEVLGVLREPAGRLLEWLLGAALLYHALNGLRIIIIDLWPAMTGYHRQLWWIELDRSSSSSACPGAIIIVGQFVRELDRAG